MTPRPPGRLLTLDDWAALPLDSGRRLELVAGELIETPVPRPLHQLAAGRLAAALQDQLPDDLVALGAAEVVVRSGAVTGSRATVRVPDVMVVPTTVVEQNRDRVAAEDVLVAVEILALDTRTTDRVTKLAEYAEAGIPGYWIVDIDPPAVTMTAHLLVDGLYAVTADAAGVVRLISPVEVTIDLSRLTDLSDR